MRKPLLTLALLALSLLMAGFVFAAEAPSGEDVPSGTLSADGALMSPMQPPVTPDGDSRRVELACSASTDCPCGNEISCTGSWDCFAKDGDYVECDGNRTNCSWNFCSARLTCPTGQRISCSGTCDRCGSDGTTIWCNGNYYTCDDCPFPQLECSF